jgi:hypothetical protein
LNGVVNVQSLLLFIGFPDERSNPRDHVSRPIAIADNAPGSFARFVEVGRVTP